MTHVFLPKEPVDGFTLEFWHVYIGISTHLEKVRYRYYKNTSWAQYVETDGQDYYAPSEKDKGAPIIDQWMVSAFNADTGHWCPTGRIEHWDVKQMLEERKDFFSTRNGAVKAIRAHFNAKINGMREQLKELEEEVKKWG